jgi:PAP2 superfamily
MKHTLFSKLGLSLILVGVMITSCDKTLEQSENFSPLNPTDQDLDAGTWTMKALASAAAFDAIVVAPADPTSQTYLDELAAIKTAQAKLDDKKRSIIKYWSAGGVLRWNQILRELVARYNLPPAPLNDDSYPIPDAENPFADPGFPFSNPPYAARAYAYVSVAQFEALKAAWHYKTLYGRKSPYQYDAAIQALVPETDLPAYPSEDAVLSGVTAEMLKLLFPAAVEEITLKAAEQRNAALWSGKATATDISVGLALGKAVATGTATKSIVVDFARKDGMGGAVGNAKLWKELDDSVGFGDCYKRQQLSWKSLDSPPRPPMLPNFCKVWGWNMTAQNFIDERPAIPPSTSSAEMAEQVKEVKYYADNITDSRLKIVHKWADGAGTYTPPGHWNDIAAEYIAKANFSEVRAARAFALLNMAMHDAAVGCWDAKFFYYNPRPSQLDPSIKTTTGVPNFPSYTSGHSTFSGAAATVLAYLFPNDEAFFTAQAAEASISRLYGAIHYRVDIEMGLDHGKVIGGYTVAFAETDGAD